MPSLNALNTSLNDKLSFCNFKRYQKKIKSEENIQKLKVVFFYNKKK